MAVAPKRPQAVKLKREIEWTTIPVWYLYGGGLAIALVLGIGGYLVYQALFGPQNKATKNIATATQLLDQARKAARPGEHDKLIETADKKLGEATAAAKEKQWDIATVAAKESIRSSEQVLEDLRERGATATVASFKRMSGNIEVKKANSTEWMPASMDTQLGANDLLRSDSGSKAEIVYANGLNVVLEHNSLIQIMRPEGPKETKTAVNVGEIKVKTGIFSIGQKDVVKTPTGEINVGSQTNALVNVDESNGSTRVDVGTGEANLKGTNGEQVKIGSSESVTATTSGVGQLEKLPQMPQTPTNQQVFEHDTDQTAVATLHWEAVPDAASYLVEVGTNALLTGKGVETPEVTRTSFVMEGYPDGEYYWRVTAITSDHRKSFPSPIQSFRIGKKGDPAGTAKADIPIPALSIQSINVLGTNVILKGHADSGDGTGAAGMTLQVDGESQEVKADGSFYSITPLREDGKNNVVVVVRNAKGGQRRTTIIVTAEYF